MERDLLLIQKARLDLSYNDIGPQCGVSQQQVGKWFTKDAGIPIDKIPDLLKALRLKIVSADAITLSGEQYKALAMGIEEFGRVMRVSYDKYQISLGDLE